jgi:chorismate dehydratase
MISSPTVKIRIGYLPYLNCEPFYFDIDRDRFEFQSLTPSAMTQSAKEGKLDAGPIPLVACFQMEDTLVPVGDFCIATVEAAQSILLFSQRPIEEMEGGTFGITDETTTSVQLLKVLLHHRYHVKPKAFTGLEDEHDAFLLIGDNALRQRAPKPSHPYRYDLGHEWHSWTGYPFVFARWVMRRELPQETQEELREALQKSLEQGLANLDVIAHKRRDLDMSEEEVIQYLQAFRYAIGPEENTGINRFRELLQSLTT